MKAHSVDSRRDRRSEVAIEVGGNGDRILVIEQEFLAVDDSPDEVFESFSLVRLLLLKIIQTELDFTRIRQATEGNQLEFFDPLFGVDVGSLYPSRGSTLFGGQLRQNLFRIEEVEALR